MLRKLFTVEEANRSLAMVRPLMEEIVGHKRRMTHLMDQVAPLPPNSSDQSRHELEQILHALESLAQELKSLMNEVEQLGAVVKDLDQGLVDFPAVLRGQPVYLCWRLGEERVEFYHRIEDGFAGRLPVPD
ncbi:MAG: DUF2203 domain-containing protein [Armatimonadetes bacterium]|nr:DUF2203 domain-containing protein [Armatimonadota bacterium]